VKEGPKSHVFGICIPQTGYTASVFGLLKTDAFFYLCRNFLKDKQMIKHIVFWKLKDEACGNNKATNAGLIKEKLEALGGQIEGLLKIEVGIDFEGSDMAADVALYTEFATKEDLNFYQQHPKHKEVQAFVGEVRSARQVVDYEI
jgi:hypothetical protein